MRQFVAPSSAVTLRPEPGQERRALPDAEAGIFPAWQDRTYTPGTRISCGAWRNLSELPTWLWDGGKRFFWVYLLSCGVLALVAYVRYHRTDGAAGGFMGFLFPKSVHAHPSARVDYHLLLANRAFLPGGCYRVGCCWGLSIATIAEPTEDAASARHPRTKRSPYSWPSP